MSTMGVMVGGRFEAPERSLQQRRDALKLANEIRSKRARLKRDLKTGRAHVVPMLLDPPDYLKTAKIFDLLLAVPAVGRVKANRLLFRAQISPSKTLGGMTDRQLGELVALMGER